MIKFYPVKVLQDALRDATKTKEYLLAQSFPLINKDEILKVDLVISDISTSIKVLEDIKRSGITSKEKYDIYIANTRGISVTRLSKQYNLDWEVIKEIIEQIKKVKY